MQSLLSSYGLNLTTVSWEDTARSKNSCWGPNISDMTLRSNGKDCKVIRRPNFADVSVDHPLTNFNVTVENENNTELRRIGLREYLNTLKITTTTDEQILCSTQACILEGDSGDIPFNVRLYNYQTTQEHPAVLVIISTNQGTSAQVLDAKTTDILFNKNGRAHDFIAERLKEERIRLGKSLEQPMSADEKERNVVFIYQVPLKVPRRTRALAETLCFDSFEVEDQGYMMTNQAYSATLERCATTKKGFDNAMLKVSSNDKGEFKGTQNKTLVRDESYPIRCTLQYYWITDTMDKMTEPLVKTMSEQLEKFYQNSANKSSLVMGLTDRPTEPKTTVELANPQFSVQLNQFM